jgi:sugar phosphate isomerase/epimerase
MSRAHARPIASRGDMSERVISYQLYSARRFPPVQPVLEAVAAIGYDAVEPYGALYEEDPAAFRHVLDRLGLRCPTAHMPLQGLEHDREKYFRIARTLGVETIVVPYLLPEERPAEPEGWRAIARQLAEHAAAAAEAGFGLAWHNHDFEYRALADGSRPIDILLAAPNVLWEADVGWIARAGMSPLTELTRHADRLIAVHAKDLAPAGATSEDGWADVGAGVIDWRSLWPLIDRSQARALVVEHDNPADWRRSAERSFACLSGLRAGDAE